MMKKRNRRLLTRWDVKHNAYVKTGEWRMIAFGSVLCEKCKHSGCKGWMLDKCSMCDKVDPTNRCGCACFSEPTDKERKFGCMYFEEDDQKIDPCPHCGCEAELIEGKPNGEDKVLYHYVRCGNIYCGCRTDTFSGEYSKQKAISAWNRRVSDGK